MGPGGAWRGVRELWRRDRLPLRRSAVHLAFAGPLIALGWAALGLVACGPTRPSVVVVQAVVPSSFDPYLHNEVVGWSVLGNVYDALVELSPEMQVQPALAVSWEQRGSSELYLRLRDGVRFHNGELLTSEHVVESFKRAATHPQSKIRHNLTGIASIEADGEQAVRITTVGPAPTLLRRLAFLFILPRAHWQADEITAPIGTGAYRWRGRGKGGEVLLEAWPGWRGQPEVRNVVVRFEQDDAARSAMLSVGGADVVERLDDRVTAGPGDRPALRMVTQPGLAVQLIEVIPAAAQGEARRALADPRVRRALLLAIDRRTLVERAYGGHGTVASQYLHPAVIGYDMTLRPEPFDAAEARGLLAGAGFPQGFEVALGHSSTASEAATLIAGDLGRVGIRVRLITAPFGELVWHAEELGANLLLLARVCLSGDGSDLLNPTLHGRDPQHGLGEGNLTGFDDPQVNSLVEAAERESDPTLRVEQLRQAQRLALRSLPILPLAVRWSYIGVSERLEITTRFDGRFDYTTFRWRP